MILCHPSLTAWGHNHPVDAEGWRSMIYRAVGFNITIIGAYFLPGIGLDQSPNQERCESIRRYIDSIKIPWIILADWNKTPGEVICSPFAKYLKALAIAPDLPFTCTSTTEAGGRLIDFALVSPELAGKNFCTPCLDTPFKPHIVGVDFHIQLGFEADLGQELIIPADLRLCHGPRLPEHSWDMNFHSTAEDEISIEFPFSKDANMSMTYFLG